MNVFSITSYLPKGYTTVKYGELRKESQKNSAALSLVGTKAPQWTLENTKSQPISLTDCKSKIILINFTGIGCDACQAAVPFLKKLRGLFNQEELEIIAIETWSRDIHKIQNYANRKELNYTI